MSKLISDILDQSRPELALKIDELERLSGRPGLDIRLADELKHIYKKKAAFLGLDRNDTSAGEIYFAMKNRVFDDNAKLEKLVGVTNEDSPKEMAVKVVKFVEKRLGKRDVWAVKTAVARKQLKANPPKKLMKIFGLRSIESALKRENPGAFYCFARFTEGKSWVAKYSSQAVKMTASDFDYLKIKISIMSQSRAGQLRQAGFNLTQIVYSDQESAYLEICPSEKRFRGDTLFVVDTLLNHIRQVVRRAEYYKSQGLRPDFGTGLERIRTFGFKSVEKHNHPFGWAALIHGSTELGITGLIDEDEPFVASVDLLVPSTDQILNLEFWKHPFAMYRDSEITVSFNLSDMVLNAVNNTPSERAYLQYGRRGLQNELFARYLHHAPVKDRAINFNFAEA